MSHLLNVLFSLTLVFSAYKLIKLYLQSKITHYIFWAVAVIIYQGVFWAAYVDPLIEQSGFIFNHLLMIQWTSVSGIAFILSGLAFLIYNSKPPFARFPLILCFIPLFIIPAYYFALHTIILKEWIMILYESGAIFIGFMMYLALLKKSVNHVIALLGVLMIGSGYALYRFSSINLAEADWIWKSMLIFGTFILIHGFEKIEHEEISEF